MLSFYKAMANANCPAPVRYLPTILLLLLSSFCSRGESFLESTEGKLVKLGGDGGELQPYRIPGDGPPEYFMVYFSAHWCAPCRKTTPALVEFYHETKRDHPGFEFIFVSADRDEASMARYMEWAQMPWPALAWDERGSIPVIAELDPNAVPFMAMLDKDGRLLGASEIGGFNIGIPKMINGLQERLGSDVYDLHERHGKKSPFILIVYLLAGAFLIFSMVRKALRRRRSARKRGG